MNITEVEEHIALKYEIKRRLGKGVSCSFPINMCFKSDKINLKQSYIVIITRHGNVFAAILIVVVRLTISLIWNILNTILGITWMKSHLKRGYWFYHSLFCVHTNLVIYELGAMMVCCFCLILQM